MSIQLLIYLFKHFNLYAFSQICLDDTCDTVTCVQFNPTDGDSFISGSLDGKVRIWEIPGCQVIDWTDITEIVAAVCYRPDGKVCSWYLLELMMCELFLEILSHTFVLQGLVVGSMTGNCLFYDASGMYSFLKLILHQ